jgi:excisionase family DNA binding protein|uniref:DNA-binding protein n=1 Tax=Meiothermus ruber TaxID=277 RepID=A0A7C3HRV9_MEIRU
MKYFNSQSYISPKQAAAILGISRGTIFSLINRGTLPAVKLGARTIRIPLAAIEGLATKEKDGR